MSDRQPVGWEKVHIFISSTFKDMHAERDYLVKRVFPELQDWCERRKLRLVDIDLRWGVTEQDATHNRNVVKVCLSRIDDCRPFFLCFLGQRRGWVPTESEVSPETFDSFPDLRQVVGAASVTEMEVLHALINPFHQSLARDPAKPAKYYERARHAFFYLRDPSYLGGLPNDPPMLRETYTNQWIADAAERQRHDSELQKWRAQEVPNSNRPFHFYETTWDPNGVTPELMIPLQCPSAEPANIERWQRQWQKAGVTVTGLNIEDDPIEGSKAQEFNTRLSAGRLSGFRREETPLSKIIVEELQEAIAARYPDHLVVEGEDELQKEMDQQEQFLFTASEGFIEREGDFAELDGYVASDSNKLFVLTAAGGMGKSTLLANWVDRYRGRIEGGDGHRDRSIHFRFIGQSDGTTTVYSMLRLLLSEIKEVAYKFDEEVPLDPVKLRNEWPALLETIGMRGKTVIVIDALNQLESGLTDVGWLPRRMPDNIKMIVSFKRGERSAEELYARFSEGNHVRLSEVKPFESLDDRRRLVREYLSQYLKELDDAHLETLINLRGAENPLYLKVLLSELRVFGPYSNLAGKIRSDFGDTPVSAFARVLERLENDPAYSPIDPKRAVPLLFGLLAHARRGLSVDELTSLFVQALELDDTDRWREAAADTVSLFLRQVRSFLARREGRYDFFFESFKIAAGQCYAADGDAETVSRRSYQEWHRLLANYFGSLPTWQEAAPSSQTSQAYLTRPPMKRKVSELPHHLTQAEEWDGVEETLCDLDFIAAKCAGGMTFDLVTDYRVALDSLPEAQEQLRERRERDERIARWTREIIEYSQAWSERRDRISRGEPVNPIEPILPEPPPCCRMWTDEEIANECRRIIENPTRLDRLTVFSSFVRAECYPLHQLGHREGFVLQHAWNHAPGGPVHDSAAEMLANCRSIVLLRRWPPDAVYNPKPALLATLEGHTSEVRSVSVTLDGRIAASGSSDNTLRVWDLENMACLHILEGHSNIVRSVIVTPDGRLGVSASWDNTLRVWDLRIGTCQRTLEGDSFFDSVCVTPDGRLAVSVSFDNLCVWDLKSGACQRTLKGDSWFTSVCVTPDGRLAVSANHDYLDVWDVESGERLLTCQLDSVGYSVSVTPNGRYAILGSGDNTLRLLDLQNGESCRHNLEGHSGTVEMVTLTPDAGRAVSAGSYDHTLRAWDLRSGSCQRILEAHNSSVDCVGLTADGGRAVSGSFDKTLRVWDLERGAWSGLPKGPSTSVQNVTLTPDGRIAISVSYENTLDVWDPESGARLETLNLGSGDRVWSVWCTPSGRRAVSEVYSELDLAQAEFEEFRRTLANGAGGLDLAQAELDCRNNPEVNLNIWDLETGQLLRSLRGHSRRISSVSVTCGGRLAVSGSFDETVRVWDLESGACLHTFEGHGKMDRGVIVTVTPDGRRAVSSSEGGLRVWDLESGACLSTLNTVNTNITDVSMTPDGRRAILVDYVSGWDSKSEGLSPVIGPILSGGRRTDLDYYSVSVWDLESGARLRTLKGHSGAVHSLRVTPDGRRVISADDKTLRIWDLESGRCLGAYSSQDSVTPLALAGYGNTICGTSGGDILFLDVQGIESSPDVNTETGAAAHEQVLRRGLEFSRREKGDDHEETLAHLHALAVHLQHMGQADEAHEVAEEYDQLTSRIAARNVGDTE